MSLQNRPEISGKQESSQESGLSQVVRPGADRREGQNVESLLGERVRLAPLSRQIGYMVCGLLLASLDLLALVFAFSITSLSLPEQTGVTDWEVSLVLALACLVVFNSLGHYFRRQPFWDELRQMLVTVFFVGAMDLALALVTSQDMLLRSHALAWSLALLLVPVLRYTGRYILLASGWLECPAVIVGDGPNAVEAALSLMDEPMMGYRLIGFLATEAARHERISIRGRSYPVGSLGNDPAQKLKRLNNPHVIVALEKGGLNRLQHYVDQLNLINARLTVVPAVRGLPLFDMDVRHVFSHEVIILDVHNNLAKLGSRLVKRSFDIVGSIFLMLMFSPLIAYVALKIRRSGGNVIFRHQRVGQGGKKFGCLKFRTMVPNAEQVLQELLQGDAEAMDEWQREFKLKKDPRITRVGRFLRKTSLDELPQLWNVLKGEMSLVGPRPVVEIELERYGRHSAHYMLVRPGMTGLWQVSGRNNIDYESRVYLDAWYVKNWSLWSDIVILLKTIKVVLSKNGAY